MSSLALVADAFKSGTAMRVVFLAGWKPLPLNMKNMAAGRIFPEAIFVYKGKTDT